MRGRTIALASVVSTCACAPLALAAQSSYSYPFAHIQHVEGEAHLQRAADPEPETGEANVPVLPGDRLWTGGGSRAEVELADGSVVRLDEGTKVDFVELGVENVLRLWSGSVVIEPADAESRIRVDAPAGSVYPTTEGVFRVDVDEDTVHLSVYRGAAELSSETASVVVHAGQASRVVLGEAPAAAYAFNTARFDDFGWWSQQRDERTSAAREVVVRSLPHEVSRKSHHLRGHGTWTSHRDYGYVWYPSVSVGWAPYRYGRWAYTIYGYTWVSHEPWGWLPYHYGRWGHGRHGWYWIPGSVWSPAWVSFAFGPYWIGWSPLGHHNRPVYVFNQVFHDELRRAKHRGHGYDVDRGWNFAHRDRFSKAGVHARLGAADIRAASGPTQVLPSPAVLDRSLSPRAVPAVAVSRTADGARGGYQRIGRSPRRYAQTEAASAARQVVRPSASIGRRAIRGAVREAPSRTRGSTPARVAVPTRRTQAVERTVPRAVARPGSVTTPIRRLPSVVDRGARSAPGSARSPASTLGPRAVERSGSRAVPGRGTVTTSSRPTRSVPARVAPRGSVRERTAAPPSRIRAVAPTRGRGLERATGSRSVPGRDAVSTRSRPERSSSARSPSRGSAGVRSAVPSSGSRTRSLRSPSSPGRSIDRSSGYRAAPGGGRVMAPTRSSPSPSPAVGGTTSRGAESRATGARSRGARRRN